ncbi:hypothetical protein VTN49DRAFT_5430 [Thermomyces lanuginosus]|uniref:uncharacterized protein n=1 Tax=Thermomyces lanuginosus TaxID=5541 RepID=UPI003741FCC4
MPAYNQGRYYPVKLGEVLKSRYRVLSKLGFGANSTVWFCRDLEKHRYVAVKIYISSSKRNQEVRVLEHLSKIRSCHPGSRLIRKMIDRFELKGLQNSIHQCIVHEPLLTSLWHFQMTLDPPNLPENLLKGALQQLFQAFDFLHSEAHVIHTDIQAKNIFISAKDDSIFREWDENETSNPSPRKICWHGYGVPLLADFGEARLGDEHEGLFQPDIYRAPEVILGSRWNSKVDIWNVGVMIWDLFEDHHLFDGRGPDGQHSDGQLLAEMIAMIGPSPIEFLHKCSNSQKYWDNSGRWIGSKGIPETSLEDSEVYLDGDNKEMFLKFVRKMLRWDPDERPSARDLLIDPWLTGRSPAMPADKAAQRAAEIYPKSIQGGAKEDLDKLAQWFKNAKKVPVEEYRWCCIDPDQLNVVRPLLEKLNLDKERFVVNLSTISGRTKIIKGHGFKNVFFPLSGDVFVGGYHLDPGEYLYLLGEEFVDGNLDFLVV